MTILGYITEALIGGIVAGLLLAVVCRGIVDWQFDKFIRTHPGVVSADDFDALVQNRRTQ